MLTRHDYDDVDRLCSTWCWVGIERVLPSEYGVKRPFLSFSSFILVRHVFIDVLDNESKQHDDVDKNKDEGLLVELENNTDMFVPMSSNDVSNLSQGRIVHKTSHGVSFKALTEDKKSSWSQAEATMLNIDNSNSSILSASRLDRADYQAGSDGSDKFESLSNEQRRMLSENKCVHIRSLRKVFHTADGTERVAVNDLRCAMFQNEIFVLLGHNGAGKSTTLSQLSGLIAPTSGDATVFGSNIVGELSQVQQMIGVCPQQNILYVMNLSGKLLLNITNTPTLKTQVRTSHRYGTSSSLCCTQERAETKSRRSGNITARGCCVDYETTCFDSHSEWWSET